MNTVEGKKYMDELYRISTMLNDNKRQALALQYLLLNQIHTNADINAIREATDSLKRFSLRNYSKVSYYFGWSQYIQVLISGDTTMHIGKTELENMMREVLEDNHIYGRIQCYRRFMSYYERLRLWKEAIAQNAEAITITEQSDPDNSNLSMYYLDQAKLLRQINNYTGAYEYIQKGLNTYKEKYHKVQLISMKCQLDAETGNYDSIIRDYNELMSDEESVQEGQNTHFMVLIRYYYNIAIGDFDKAAAAIRDIAKMDVSKDQVVNMKLMLGAIASDKLTSRYNIKLPYKIKESMLEYSWSVDSINSQVSKLMGDETIKQLDTPIMIRQQGELERAAGARRRMIGQTMLSICFILIITLIVLIIRTRKSNRKMRELTSAFAMKNLRLQQRNEELQGTINTMRLAYDRSATRLDDVIKDSKMKSTFIMSLAKELRLVAINGLNKATVPQLLEYAKNMEILQNLATRKHINIESINLNATCQKIFDKYIAENPPANGLTFYFEPTQERNVNVEANSELLALIISNLLRLSQRHTNKGEIILKTRRAQNGHLQMIVSDTGAGIPLNKRDRMFERLSEMEDSDTGTILHLTICRVAAHSQNCRIWLDTSRHSALGTSVIVEF